MEKTEQAVRAFGQHFARVHGKDVAWTQRFKSGDDAAIDELIGAACAEAGLNRAEYDQAVSTDVRLAALQHELISEAILSELNLGSDNPLALESSGARRPTDETK